MFLFSEQALEDITLDDIDIHNLDKELDNDTNSLSSSISAGLSSGTYILHIYLPFANSYHLNDKLVSFCVCAKNTYLLMGFF